jgi:N-acetyl-beta-hexosaminidase
MCECPAVINATNVDTQFWRASFDPTKDAVYSFLDRFIGEMASLFPDKVFHIGGDEVVRRLQVQQSIQIYTIPTAV